MTDAAYRAQPLRAGRAPGRAAARRPETLADRPVRRVPAAPGRAGRRADRAQAAQRLADFYQARADRTAARAAARLPARQAMRRAMPDGTARPMPTMAGRRTAAAGPRQPTTSADPVKRARRYARQQARDRLRRSRSALRMNAALTTPTPFVERLVHFWANHFAVSADKLHVIGLAGPFEFEAIRPHVLGRFRDMLFAVERHPAMLLYLDQAQSVGPNSMLAQAGARRSAGREPQGRAERESRARDHGAAHAGRAHRLYAGRRHRIRARDDRLDRRRAWARRRRAVAGERARRAISCSPTALHEPGDAHDHGQDAMREGGVRAGVGGARRSGGPSGHRAPYRDQAGAPFRRRRSAARAGRAAGGGVPARRAATCRRSTAR